MTMNISQLINKFAIILFYLCFLPKNLFAQTSILEEKPFVVVIPSYNNKDWYQKNLDSVLNQRYQNFRIIYLSDGSTDGTDKLVEDYVKQKNQEDRFTLIKIFERRGALACLCQAIFSCDKNEIIVDLNGNDWLAHDRVLATLNKAYADPNVWMTYGQFMYFPEFNKGFAAQVPQEVIDKNQFRSAGGLVTHLKTFYAGLFQEINKEDFLFEDEFIREAYDLAYMIPICEMAGTHYKFIPQVLYIYNHSEPLNFHKKPTLIENEMDKFIRKKEKYQPLDELTFSEKGDIVPWDSVYSQFSDLYHPTLQDYQLLQNFLSREQYRTSLDPLEDMADRMSLIKIIGNTADELPQANCVHVHCDQNQKENCVILYSTFNFPYPRALKRILKLIKESDYSGDVLYRLGGWPDTEGGSLVLSHVPFAFKVSFFKEAQKLGYKRVLWLDTAVVPIASLNDIFDSIQEKGYFVMGNSHMVGPYINPAATVYFGISYKETYHVPSCSAGLFGVDFTNPLGQKIVDRWYRAAHDKDAFFSRRSDQSALSIILYQSHINDLVSMDRMPHSKNEIKSDSLFWLDREMTFD